MLTLNSNRAHAHTLLRTQLQYCTAVPAGRVTWRQEIGRRCPWLWQTQYVTTFCTTAHSWEQAMRSLSGQMLQLLLHMRL